MRRNKKKGTLVITVFCITVSAALCIWISRQPSFNPGRIYHNDDLLVREQAIPAADSLPMDFPVHGL